MGRIFLDPFPYNLHKVFHLRRLRVSQHCNDFIESLAVFFSSDYLLENSNGCAAFSLPVPTPCVKLLHF